jgi:hypothetical protein
MQKGRRIAAQALAAGRIAEGGVMEWGWPIRKVVRLWHVQSIF